MKRIVTHIALTLVLAEVVLVFASWLLSATMTEDVRSLLSSEGIRWFFGSFTAVLQKPLLVWLLLGAMAWGCLVRSRLLQVFSTDKTTTTNRRRGFMLRLLLAVLMAYAGVIVLLTAVPHAVLLSATGSLWPSAFSRSLVPIAAFGAVLLSAVYGLLSRSFTSLHDVCQSLVWGLSLAAPLFFVYVLAVQFYESFRFAFL